ncbi:Concanavalin A-like lectin/glucanases superfamily protein [Humidesulfovibrio mexicanus]|uniref:Concanavalin A-like lectin/glucanases superfamily protein n=1 Tax=Humidesulfovibrio mexicanus TaxID=147047 RepID=A0A239BNU0_9BACT|nr:LamG domain-containing protein [Humidesulfovibrio mexicanus]SNS09536.1 Concanavalin A-like lectin/glucanases superfamily protein [Humidesulfovibrio mexicanus]
MRHHTRHTTLRPRQGGSIVVYLIIALAAFGVLAMAGGTRFGSAVTSVFSPNCATNARYMAESGLRYAMARLRDCADEACVTSAVSAMNGQSYTVDAGKGLSFSLAVTYDAGTKTAQVTSTGNGCTNITGVTASSASSVYLSKIAGTSGDIDFSDLGDDFTITTPTGGSSPISVDATGKLVFLGVLGDTYNSAAIWYTSNNTYCTEGVCTMDYGLRAYFEAQWDTASVADGIVFGIKSALTNVALSAGGDPYKDMGEVMGWAGPGPQSLGYDGIKPPKIGLELDTWRNNDGSTIYNADSRADKNYYNSSTGNRDSDHMAYVFWGSTSSVRVWDGWGRFWTATYDDNRHAESFTDNDAGDDGSTEPRSYHDLDGSGDGRWGYYYKKTDRTWLRNGTKYLVRFELSRLPSYPNAQGNYPYLLKTWVRTGTQTADYSNVNADYTAGPPDMYRAIFLSPAMHANLSKIMLGFTEATGSRTQKVTVSGLKASFRQTQETPVMPTDHVAYFPMSEGSGTTLSDANGTTATLYNGPTWLTGCAKCPALNFDGNNDVAFAPSSPATAPGESGTVSAWYSIPTLPGAYAGLVHKGERDDFHDESYSLQMYGYGVMALVVRQSNSRTVMVQTNVTAGTGWHHVAATWTPSELLIYIDGELKGRTENTNGYAARASSGGLVIGAQAFDTADESADYVFKGRLSRVAIYNRALSPLEVARMAVAP